MVLEEMPDNVSFSATTKTLSLKVTKAAMTGKVTIAQVYGKFLEKLKWAYDFEKTIESKMPNMFQHHLELGKTLDKLPNDEQWSHNNRIIRSTNSFNLLYRMLVTYKSTKNKSIRNNRGKILGNLLTLDDVEMWETHWDKHIYSVTDLIKWYNDTIKPIEAILIDPEAAGEIE